MSKGKILDKQTDAREVRREFTRRSYLKMMSALGLAGVAGTAFRGLAAPSPAYAAVSLPSSSFTGGSPDGSDYHGGVVPMAADNPSVVYYNQFCKKEDCGKCSEVCHDIQSVFDYWDSQVAEEIVCVHCGQCTAVCPGTNGTPAMRERNETAIVSDALANPDYHVIVQTAPATRVALGEEFGLPPGTWAEGQQVAALRRLGFDTVLDTNFTADLTIMEEATEFVSRVVNGTAPLPMFTSCCSSWVKFLEYFYPELLIHQSSCKSPQAMFGTLAKTYYAEANGIDPEKIISVSIMPCTAKKFEIQREELNAAGHYWDNQNISRDVDTVLTTRELARMIKDANIDFAGLPEESYDSMMSEDTGAGMIFGVTGGVMEAALRTACFFLTGEDPAEDFLNLTPVRGLEGIKEASLEINGTTVKVAVAHGLRNARTVCDMILAGNPQGWNFLEFMACPGGCANGGGQPRTAVPPSTEITQSRIDSIYAQDADSTRRCSYLNEEVLALYENFLGEPLSEESHHLLHTTFQDRGPVA